MEVLKKTDILSIRVLISVVTFSLLASIIEDVALPCVNIILPEHYLYRKLSFSIDEEKYRPIVFTRVVQKICIWFIVVLICNQIVV